MRFYGLNLQHATFSVSVRKRTVRTKFEQSQNKSKCLKSTSITENRPLQNCLRKHWKQYDSKCQQERLKFDPRVTWTFWTVQLLKKDPKPLVVFSVVVDTTMLFFLPFFLDVYGGDSKRFGSVGCQALRKYFAAGAELWCEGCLL